MYRTLGGDHCGSVGGAKRVASSSELGLNWELKVVYCSAAQCRWAKEHLLFACSRLICLRQTAAGAAFLSGALPRVCIESLSPLAFQDLKPSNLAVNEDCELKVRERRCTVGFLGVLRTLTSLTYRK